MITKMSGKRMLIGGKWEMRQDSIEVRNPEDNSLIDTVPRASTSDVLYAIEQAKEGAKTARDMPTSKRIQVLKSAADYVGSHREEFIHTIVEEGSKTLEEASGEVARCIETLTISAEEARRITGETIPFDQAVGKENRVGYYYRFPIGIVAAITPFNDPLNLVAHKIGPAIASGNAIIVKPATLTPLSAILLAEAFEAAGLPEKVLSIITGRGSEIGDILVTHPAIQMISFTGGLETGKKIAHKAGLKKIGMELGSNSPTIVLNDADIDSAVDACVSGGFTVAGQNCIGVQRVYIEKDVFEDFAKQMVEKTKKLKMGSKKLADTDMGPLIHEKEAIRVEEWVAEAVDEGAIVWTGGKRDGAFYSPTVMSNVSEDSHIAKEEVFGPVVLLYPVDNLEEAITRANSVNFGLQAGIFTSRIDAAFEAARRLEVGGVMINDSSDFRIDGMPFGGVKGSGLGREGIKFAIAEMTDPKVINFKL